MKHLFLTTAATVLLFNSAAKAQDDMPDIAAAMLTSAFETGDETQVTAVQNALKGVFPAYVETIDATASAYVSEIMEAKAPEEVAENVVEELQPTGGLFAIAPWEGKAIAGVSTASGNSDNTSIGLALDARREAGKLAHNVSAYLDIADASNQLTQKRWGLAYQLDYLISDRTYAYGRLAFDEDQFSGFDYRLFAGAGVGHFIYKSDPLTWKIEGGPGYQYSPIDDTRETLSSFALYASSETDWLIREGLLFEQDFRVTWTSPTTTLQSITALTTSLTETLGAGIAYEVRHGTNPPFGRENTDTILRANLNYGF